MVGLGHLSFEMAAIEREGGWGVGGGGGGGGGAVN